LKTEDVKAAIARAEAASPGPWFATDARETNDGSLCDLGDRESHDSTRWPVGRTPVIAGWSTDGGYSGYGICEHDAVFIAAARSDVPAMGARILELEAQLAALTPRPTVRVVKVGEVAGVEMLQTQEFVSLPVAEHAELLARLASAEGRLAALAPRAVPSPFPPDPPIDRTDVNAVLAVAHPVEHPTVAADALPAGSPRFNLPDMARKGPIRVSTGTGDTFHAMPVKNEAAVLIGFSPPGANQMMGMKMELPEAELAKAAFGAAINEAKRRSADSLGQGSPPHPARQADAWKADGWLVLSLQDGTSSLTSSADGARGKAILVREVEGEAVFAVGEWEPGGSMVSPQPSPWEAFQDWKNTDLRDRKDRG
jgi:hypothetical protein